MAPALIAASLVLAAWMVYPVLRIQYQHERELQTLQGELDGLKSRNEELREQVDGLKTPEGVERLARDTLGLVKPGEQAYVVTGGTLGESSASVLASSTVEVSVWQRALDALFGFR
ncbi:MAG: septum formation initiator family protein [Coriobacteriia bacterium]|nr:septum formation initiator family protein [Coriobacteriia bacterium]